MNTQNPLMKHEMAFCPACKRQKPHLVCFDLQEKKHLVCRDCGSVIHVRSDV
jgi:uncharacterized protein YbaR (Trm112 family)